MYARNEICPDKALTDVCLCVCVCTEHEFTVQISLDSRLYSKNHNNIALKKKNNNLYISVLFSPLYAHVYWFFLLLLGQWGKSSSKLWHKRHHNTAGTVNSNSDYEVFVCDVFIIPC